jgi:hypothetical protein
MNYFIAYWIVSVLTLEYIDYVMKGQQSLFIREGLRPSRHFFIIGLAPILFPAILIIHIALRKIPK